MFTPDAEHDIEDLATYLQSLPQVPALRIGRQIQEAIGTIVRFPGLGKVDKRLTSRSSIKVFRFVAGEYILFYNLADEAICVLGILHGKRDLESILSRRTE